MNVDLSVIAAALASLAHLLGASAVTVDAVLNKRNVPSVIGWIGLAWLVPLVGPVIYLCFGINRIKRKAVALQPRGAWQETVADLTDGTHDLQSADEPNITEPPALAGLARLARQVTGMPLTAGNQVVPLVDGDETFPAMLAAIDGAQQTITLASYIFDTDATGGLFLEALVRAQQRGVAVRVLIDAVGARYSKPTMVRMLKRRRIPVAAFLPTRAPRLFQYANLRNHRKILVVDGQIGFIGGTNIRDGHWLARKPAFPVRCLHFQVEGPVVDDLQRTFAMDWAFTTGEVLQGPTWFPELAARGGIPARGVRDGPDEDIDKILDILLGALSAATRRVVVATPYFILGSVVSRMLQVTAMRGVSVDIVIPAKSNIPLMDWATAPQLEPLLERGCRIFLSPAPFDHSKAMVIDGLWSLIGSSNWDPRSLRLNFEYNLECYDVELAARLTHLVDSKIAVSRPVTLDEVRSWSLPVRLRNGLARLFSPYL